MRKNLKARGYARGKIEMSGGMGGSEVGEDPPTTTKGDISGFSTTFSRIPIGSDSTVLTADSTEALGLKWKAPAGSGKLEKLFEEVTSSSQTVITSSVAMTPANYSQIILILSGKTSASATIQLTSNGNTSNYYGNGGTVFSNGVRTAYTFGGIAYYPLASTATISGGIEFTSISQLTLNGITAYPSIQTRCNNQANLYSEDTMGALVGGSITELEITLSTGNFIDNTICTIYGVAR